MLETNVKSQIFTLAEINELHQIDALIQERRNSSALALVLRLFCFNPPKSGVKAEGIWTTACINCFSFGQ